MGAPLWLASPFLLLPVLPCLFLLPPALRAVPELDNLIVMESLCYSGNKGSDDAYDVSTSLTGYEPNFMAFSELNDSPVPFSYIIPSSDQDMDDVTLGKLLTEAPRTSRLLRTKRHVSQSVVIVCCVRWIRET